VPSDSRAGACPSRGSPQRVAHRQAGPRLDSFAARQRHLALAGTPLTPPDPEAIADAMISLVSRPLRRERLGRAALEAVHGRTWEASLDRLAAGYRLALDRRTAGEARSVA
jgi:glycosyltransferase involved in cell wall biosynthesis